MPVCFELSIAKTLDVINLRPGLDCLCNVTASGAVALKELAVLDWFRLLGCICYCKLTAVELGTFPCCTLFLDVLKSLLLLHTGGRVFVHPSSRNHSEDSRV